MLILAFKGLVMAQAVSRWPIVALSRAQSEVSLMRNMVEKVAMGQVPFPPDYLKFCPCQYLFHQFSVVYLYLYVALSRANVRSLGTFQKTMLFLRTLNTEIQQSLGLTRVRHRTLLFGFMMYSLFTDSFVLQLR